MASVLDLVKHYQHSIEKYPNDEQRVLKSIDKLYNLDVTVQHLQDTGVGRTVNALRKEPGNVGQAAKALVYKWKVMVASEESDHEDHNNDTTSHNGHENGRGYEDNSRQSNNRNNRHENSVKESKIEDKYNKQMNGDYGSKRKYHSSEEDDPHTKKGKYSSSKDNSYKIKTETKIIMEPKTESEDSQDDSSQSDSDSEYSQSSDEDRKPEVKVKIEKVETNRHEISKQTSSSRDKYKLESDSKNSIERSDKHHRHSSSDNRHSSDKILKEKSNYSDSHKRSKERERSYEIKEKDHKSLEKEKKHRDESTSRHLEKHKSSGSSEKHSSSSKKGSSNKNSSESFDIQKSSSSSERHKSTSSSEKYKSSATEKQKINSDKSSSQSDKSSSHIDKHSSSKSGKERHKHSEKETSDKHRSKDSSSSKEKHSSFSKDKSKDKSSSNEKEYSEKSEKKHSKDKESKYDKQHSDHEKSKKRKHKSSKSQDTEPKKKRREDTDGGIDCGSGASFAEALGMISPAKPKKKLTYRDTVSPNSSNEDLSPATLLAPSAKLAPLPALEISALPEISNNYRPRPPPKFLPHFTDEEALSAGISSKNQRTKVYSGNKVIGKITSLYELCVQVLQEHIDALEYTGGVPYEILKPVVDKATPQQLFMLEHYNAYLMDDTDHLWQKFCEKNFRNNKRAEMETWREMYMRCQEEQEIKLKSLTANIRIAQEAKKAPIKQTKMAYVDSVVKPPRNILKKQAQHGTAFAAAASPAARVASLATAPNVLKGGRPAPVPISTSSSSSFKPKKAPLMQKALQFMRGRKR